MDRTEWYFDNINPEHAEQLGKALADMYHALVKAGERS